MKRADIFCEQVPEFCHSLVDVHAAFVGGDWGYLATIGSYVLVKLDFVFVSGSIDEFGWLDELFAETSFGHADFQ